MKIIMDASTCILLGKASVLEIVSDSSTVYVAQKVYEEVMDGRVKRFQDALLLERLKDMQKIRLIDVNESIATKVSKDFNMGQGEASTIALGIEKKGTVVATDNRQGRKAALVNSLSLVGSIELIVSLMRKKAISQAKAHAALKVLKEEGWFDSSLIEKAMEDIQ